MKILFCSDLLLGSANTENIDVKRSKKWKAKRIEKFHDLVEKAAQNHAIYIALFGQLFGQDKIPESVIDNLFEAACEDKNIQILLFFSSLEYKHISYRNDIPKNLSLIRADMEDTYKDDNIYIKIKEKKVHLQLGNHTHIEICKSEEDSFQISGIASEVKNILALEPTGFEDSNQHRFGYSVLEWNEEGIKEYREKEEQSFAYKTVDIKILPEEEQKDILKKINLAVSALDRNTFLRINLIGKTAFAFMIYKDQLKNQLQNKFFYVEIYDNTFMDTDDIFENDISLKSEFVRLAMQDETLSESERNRLICCGWNVLNGREVSDE